MNRSNVMGVIALTLLVGSPNLGWGADAMQGAAPPPVRPVDAAAQKNQTPAPMVLKNDSVTLNLVNTEIEGVIKVVGELTGRNFILDPRVKGTITVVSAKPIARAMVYPLFLSALRLQGFTAIEERAGIVQIVPEGEAKLHAGPIAGPGERVGGDNDQIQTRVFALKYESAAQLATVLRPMISPNNTIGAAPNTNALVITDYASNLRRIERIIEAVDQPNDTDTTILPLSYASAFDMAQTVRQLFGEQAPGATEPQQRIVVIADQRSNSVLVRGANPLRLTRIRALVASLDTQTSSGGNIHVVALKHAEAAKLAETLRAIYQGNTGGGQNISAAATASPLARPAAAPVLGAPASTPSAPQPPGMLQGLTPFAPAVAAAQGGIIQADVPTNSIIITAPDAIYNNLRAVIEKLDIRRLQVYVEALVAEVTAQKAAEFGIQWQALTSGSGSSTRAFGGTNFGTPGQNILSAAQNPLTAGQGLNIGVIMGTLTIPGINTQILNMGLLVRALESESNANILATPTVLTLDNEEATIVVGQNVPFITGQYAISGAATTPTPFQTIERRDVGLTLRIRPQITEGGVVRLQIYEEASSVQDTTNAAGLITNKRAVQATVLVNDGQIVVIGGLIQDSVTDGVQKVPVMGDLPLIGSLFNYRTRSRTKTNLMVFLRPTILRDAARSGEVSRDAYEAMRDTQGQAVVPRHPGMPDIEAPRFPALPQR